jgi:hypothetical protein
MLVADGCTSAASTHVMLSMLPPEDEANLTNSRGLEHGELGGEVERAVTSFCRT